MHMNSVPAYIHSIGLSTCLIIIHFSFLFFSLYQSIDILPSAPYVITISYMYTPNTHPGPYPMHVKCGSRWEPIESALYCPQCAAIRGQQSTFHEPVSWFCEQCLAEYTKLGARTSANRCTRNCVACPLCSAVLSKEPTSEHTLEAKCSMCEYKYTFLNPKTSGLSLCKQTHALRSASFAQVKQFVDNSLPKLNSLDTPKDLSESQVDEIQQLNPREAVPPQCIALRAKSAKLCRHCGFKMVDPERQVKAFGYNANHSALNYLPVVEIYKTKDGEFKVVLWSEKGGKVTLYNQLAKLELVLTPPDSKALEFNYPLFLVERESIASRQSFMRGEKTKQSGPGWAVGDLHDVKSEELDAATWVYCFDSKQYEIKVPVRCL